MNVNIGGGNFKHDGWVNLDAIAGVELTPQTVFLVANQSAPIVYSSHCFEHLDDETVYRMLVEARRVLAPDGKFVLKLPDYEKVVDKYIQEDAQFFEQWGIRKLTPLWMSQKVEDTLTARAAMIFCGVWNAEYGDKNAEFTKRIGNVVGAYHGPVPNMDDETRRFMMVNFTPRQVAQGFVSAAPKGWHFNHRNAWNRIELCHVLRAHGFTVESMDQKAAMEVPIHGIGSQAGISMYAICS